MSKVFSNAYTSSQLITLDGMAMTYGTNGGAGNVLPLFVQGVTIQYNRATSPIHTLNIAEGEDTLLQIVGRPQGSLSIATVLGASGSELAAFLEAMGRSCSDKGTGNTITLAPKPVSLLDDYKCSKELSTYTLGGVIMLGWASQMQSGPMPTITDQLSFTFTTLDISMSTNNR